MNMHASVYSIPEDIFTFVENAFAEVSFAAMFKVTERVS
jgi:hypothetical protein